MCRCSGGRHEQCSLHHILMLQSGARLLHCVCGHMKHLSIFTTFAEACHKTEAAMCVPAAALWSGMTSDQNIPAEGGKLSGLELEMQHDDGGGARGRGQHCSLHQHTEISLHLPCPGETLPL